MGFIYKITNQINKKIYIGKTIFSITVWVGGDTDTICAIVGSMAEPLFAIPEEIEEKMWGCLDEDIKNIVRDFEWRTR